MAEINNVLGGGENYFPMAEKKNEFERIQMDKLHDILVFFIGYIDDDAYRYGCVSLWMCVCMWVCVGCVGGCLYVKYHSYLLVERQKSMILKIGIIIKNADPLSWADDDDDEVTMAM